MRRAIEQVTPSESHTRNQRRRFNFPDDAIAPNVDGETNVTKYFQINEVAYNMFSDMKLPNSLWNILFPISTTSSRDTSRFDQKYTTDSSYDWYLHETYVETIFALEHNREREFHSTPDYFMRHPQLTPYLRCSLVQLMVTSARKLSFQEEVLHNAVQLVDRYLSHTNNILVNELDEIGAAALLLAYKNENSLGPIFPLRWICSLMSMDYMELRSRVLQREVLIGMTLNWQLFTQSSYAFLRRFSLMFNLEESHRSAIKIAKCIVERTLLETDMLQFLPSTIAVMALFMSISSISAHHLNSSKSVDWMPDLLAVAKVDHENLQLCLCTFRKILQEETFLRASTFSRRLLGSLPHDSSVTAYDALLDGLANEIDRISTYLSSFQLRTPEDEKIMKNHGDYLEYLASIPGIFEYAAKLKLLGNPSIIDSAGESREETIFSSQAGLEDSFLSIVSESNSDTPFQPPAGLFATTLSPTDLCSERNVSFVVNAFLEGTIPNLHQPIFPTVMIDSVVFRYPFTYKYLVTHPPLDL